MSDVVILLREQELGGDGSVIVAAADKGMLPRNWMPAQSVITKRPGGYVIDHRSGEQLEIFVDRVYSESVVLPEMVGKLEKLGAEREFSDLLAGQLEFFGEDGQYELIGREWRTTAGPVDLLLRDLHSGSAVIVEVKRVKVTLSDVWQCLRYLAALREMDGFEDVALEGVMAAPSLANNARDLLATHTNMRFIRVSYADLAGI